MPPPPKPSSEDSPESSGTGGRKLIQTKLNFPRLLPRPPAESSSSSSSSSASTTPGLLTGGHRGPDGLYRHRQWLRQDPPPENNEEQTPRQRQQQQNIRGGGPKGEWCSLGPRVLNQPSRGKQDLAAVARETIALIPGVLALHPLPRSVLYSDRSPPGPVPKELCPNITLPYSDPEAPGFPGTRIRVVDGDSFDVAASLGQVMSDPLPVLVLNLANAQEPGGGFLGGAMAQEEELCFRSTLYTTLTPTFYPLPRVSAIYSPEVIVFRTSVATGHSILQPHEYKRVSVLSMAAEYRPRLKQVEGKPNFARQGDCDLMVSKIRLMLRIAKQTGHRRLVLGAIGCGVFGNPSQQVAEIFREVFMQEEFSGGWWRDVVFAVLDTETREGTWGKWGSGPYGSFWKVLDGVPV